MIADLRALEPPQLESFTNSLVEQVVAAVTDKIPHLESSLAVAELTVALHYVLNTPEDVLVWDVGHQGYIHKALTGQMEELVNMRKPGGLSGFLKRDESPYDFFGAGHASTSISALAGVCLADQVSGKSRQRVAVIGDGSLTGGQSFEALNHLGSLGADALVIINDNEGSIDATIGALHHQQSYGTYVQSLGWQYTFLEQGNDVRALVEALQHVLAQPGPQTLHIKTKRPDLSPPKSYKPGTTFQWWAAETMGVVLEKHLDIQLLSPAMFAGSGFGPLRELYPNRLIDTGINEAHTVSTAAGIVAAGGKAWVHIYSTFLQRAFDQLIHDVALQHLPVVFLVDRAGVVGSDGPTHHGVFDGDFLMNIPGATVWNPRNGNELQGMLLEAAARTLEGPLFIRYPKSRTEGGTPKDFVAYEWMQKSGGSSLWLSTGALSGLIKKGQNHLHLGQNWPFSADFSSILSDFEEIHVFEESTGFGGLAGAVSALMAELDHPGKCITHKLPLEFIEHGPRLELLREHGFNNFL